MILPHDQAGSGPAVLLLHAGVADRRMWGEHLEPLAAAGYRAVAVDLPGFGDAPVSDGLQAPWVDVTDTLDALGIGRAALVGNSFGGGVALRAAVAAPERVCGLMLVSALPLPASPSPQLAAAWDAEEAAFARGDLDGAVQAVLDAWTLPDSPAGVRDRVALMQRHTLELEAGRSQESRPEGSDPLEPFPQSVSGLGLPALVLVGERDMPDFRLCAERLTAGLPGSRLAVVPGAGHLAPLEAPREFRRRLVAFLKETFSASP